MSIRCPGFRSRPAPNGPTKRPTPYCGACSMHWPKVAHRATGRGTRRLGNPTDRIDPDVSAALLPFAPAAVSATLFRYGGQGQVVIVGPAGFLSAACLQVSAVTVNLRPFDTAVYNAASACPDNVAGRAANVGCVGDTAIMVDVVFPQGQAELEEGGLAVHGGVRVAWFVRRPG